jgi:hypothetical protein
MTVPQPGTLDGMPVLAMSVAGMLAMKEQFPQLRNGRPWRQKDIDDLEILRGLAARPTRSPDGLDASDGEELCGPSRLTD